MPTLEIDGKQIAWEGKKTILQACTENGVEIPHYCYHPGLSVVASCRICLVEVEQPDAKDPTKLVRIPKLLPSCQTPAVNGMKVYSSSPKAKANQQAVMEFLLVNHPLDCPVCDQAGECYLQDYSRQYGRAQSRFEEDKQKNPKKDVGNNILLYSDRCILCTRCVRFTREVTGTNELAVMGRGSKEEIDVFPGRGVNNPLAGNVVDLCPVGALLDKDFLFTQRVWFLKSTPSVSPLNSLGENIFIHHNAGRIYRLKPRSNAQVNQWWISDETRYGFKFVHAEDRLATPERIQYGANTQTSWDRAYAETDELLRAAVKEKGAGALAVVISPFDATEEIFLQVKYARSIDPQAWLVLAPPKVDGTDQVFKNPATGQTTFTLKAEKAPNRKGAEKIIAHFGGNTCDIPTLAAHIKAKKVTALLYSGMMLPGAEDDHAKTLLAGTIIATGSRKHALYEKATVSLPVTTFAEKPGSWENCNGLIQSFVPALTPLGEARPLGQVYWDLLAQPGSYDIASVRQQMASAGLAEYAAVLPPPLPEKSVEILEFAEL
jgi:NADH-quinone oxidoreductase subunit G